MAIKLDNFLRAKRFSQEFILDETLKQVLPKIGSTSIIGTAIADAIAAIPPVDLSPFQLKLQKLDGTDLPAGSKVPVDTQIPQLVKDNETVTEINDSATSKAYVFTNEAGVDKLLTGAQFISADASNALGTGTDGGLKVVVPAVLPDDQLLSGDNSGTVSVTLTPDTTTTPGRTDYTLKADLKVALLTPSAGINALKWGTSGFYVDTVSGGGSVSSATDTVEGIVTLNQIRDLAKIQALNEGVAFANNFTTVNFVGTGVNATQSGTALTVTVPGATAPDAVLRFGSIPGGYVGDSIFVNGQGYMHWTGSSYAKDFIRTGNAIFNWDYANGRYDIEQWAFNFTATNNTFISFPQAFPSAVSVIIVCDMGSIDNGIAVRSTGLNTSGFTPLVTATSSPIAYIAKGY